MADSDSTSPDKKRQEPPPIEFLKPGEEQPAAPPPQQPAAWVTRPEDYMRPRSAQAPAPPRPMAWGGGRMSRLAGIVLALAGVTSIAYLLGTSLTPLSVAQYQNISNNSSLYAFNQVCGTVVTWSQAIALLAGVMAFQRMNWKFTVACAFFVMLSLAGLFLLVTLGGVFDGFLALSGFLSLLGFVLVLIGRAEFVS